MLLHSALEKVSGDVLNICEVFLMERSTSKEMLTLLLASK